MIVTICTVKLFKSGWRKTSLSLHYESRILDAKSEIDEEKSGGFLFAGSKNPPFINAKLYIYFVTMFLNLKRRSFETAVLVMMTLLVCFVTSHDVTNGIFNSKKVGSTLAAIEHMHESASIS